MNKTFTFDDLILLAYNEKNMTETEEICNFLSVDEEMCEEYLSILSVKNNLDNLNSDPPDDIIQGLINYSKSIEVIRVRPDVETVFIIKN